MIRVDVIGRGIADVGAQHDQGRLRCFFGGVENRLESIDVVTNVAYLLNVPPVRPESCGGVFVDGEVGGAVDGDFVVVENADEMPQAEMACPGSGLVAYALHEATVACDHKGVVVYCIGSESSAQVCLGNGHTHGVRKALTERTRCHRPTSGCPGVSEPHWRNC